METYLIQAMVLEILVSHACVFYFILTFPVAGYEEQNPDETETSFSFHRWEAFPCLAWNLLASL